ncbi:hypothetical protein [Noviherbaspirillum saxi]|uniref:Uncharacterized protein n=1 Tax=Noviherbaspirillum saxi TaxID=2320863 RepID=A0A3A3FP88_9BURK|nr:hypothetical protein [Noviherbaspirillum saxi]RJF97703.1 hypothetical protein D3871_03585 [Noviherbaspirillum saxi]
MAFVSITEAAKLVRRNRSTLYRDIERGRLSKTVTPEGETQIETSELLRTYGRLHANDPEHGFAPDHDKMRITILEERNRSLERALTLEAELRKVKDQVTSELRARLADKDSVIKVLESKVLFLEYDKQVESLTPAQQTPSGASPDFKSTEKPPEVEPSRPPRQMQDAAPPPTPAQSSSESDGPPPPAEPVSPPPIYVQKSAEVDTPIPTEHIMPRKGWWARLLHRH